MKISPVKLGYQLGVLNHSFNAFARELGEFEKELPEELFKKFRKIILNFDELATEIIMEEFIESCSFEDDDE